MVVAVTSNAVTVDVHADALPGAADRGDETPAADLAPFLASTAFVQASDPALKAQYDRTLAALRVPAIGIAYAALAGMFIYRRFDWRRLTPMLVETATLSGSILFIIGAASAMAWALTQSGFSIALATAMKTLLGGAPAFMGVSIVAFILLGGFLEGIPAIVLFGPLLFPIARSLGVHEVHYAMVVVLSMGLGLFAPPLGVGYYAACAIGQVDPDAGMRPIWLYMVALLIGLIAVAAVPWLSIGFL